MRINFSRSCERVSPLESQWIGEKLILETGVIRTELCDTLSRKNLTCFEWHNSY